MNLSDALSYSHQVLFDGEVAETATYNGIEINVVELVTSEHNTNIPGFTIPVYSVLVKSSDVSRPKGGDTVVFRGKRCTVGQFPRSEGDVWQIDLHQDTIQA